MILSGYRMLQGYEGYDAVRKTSGVRDRSDEGRFRVTGPDRASWLQGLLTNDILAVKPGGGCYAAYLTPQGRMISDVRVLERGDFMLLDVPAAQKAFVLDRLTTFIIMEDVAVDDVTVSLGRVAVHGPGASTLLEGVLKVDDGTALASLAEHASTVAQFERHPVVVAGSRELGGAASAGTDGAGGAAGASGAADAADTAGAGAGDVAEAIGVTGFDVYCPAPVKEQLLRALIAAGAEPIADRAWHALRIEAGRPLFGVDMTTDTIPLEAGIEGRAISFTKGCYVGQEIIIRVMHRGGGRVARKLVGLRPAAVSPSESAPDWPDDASAVDTPLFAGEKSIGRITSAAWSPLFGHWIAMGYVQRESAEPGTHITLGQPGAGGVAAVVTAL
jgi:folate-binding protein YgfZ